jgi:hypothetical protein
MPLHVFSGDPTRVRDGTTPVADGRDIGGQLPLYRDTVIRTLVGAVWLLAVWPSSGTLPRRLRLIIAYPHHPHHPHPPTSDAVDLLLGDGALLLTGTDRRSSP